MTPPIAVLFDGDGVLQRAPANLKARLAQLLGGTPSDADAWMADIFAAEAPALIGSTDFREALKSLFANRRATCDAATFLDAWLTIDVDHSVLALVSELRTAGVYCALTSDQESHRARHMSEMLGYASLFDREFYSCHLGLTKPSAAYFAEVIRLADRDPRRTLFIDDRPQNVEGARSAGLRAERFVLGEMGRGGGAMRRLLRNYRLLGG